MGKKTFILALVALIVLVAATPALAAMSRFTLPGEITAIDLDARTITIKAYNGNPLIRGGRGIQVADGNPPIKGEQTVLVTDDTRFWRCGEGPISFDEVGLEEAIVRGKVEDGVLVAERVTVSPLHLRADTSSH